MLNSTNIIEHEGAIVNFAGEPVVDGLPMHDYYELGRAMYTAMLLVDKLEEGACEGRREGYRLLASELSDVLGGLDYSFREACGECGEVVGDDDHPYPRLAVVGGAPTLVSPHGEAEAAMLARWRGVDTVSICDDLSGDLDDELILTHLV